MVPISNITVTKRGLHCMWCGDHLSLIKRLGKHDFCSGQHEVKYYEEQQYLMVERLRASHLRLQRAITKPKRFRFAKSA